jgi:hypothetical protein
MKNPFVQWEASWPMRTDWQTTKLLVAFHNFAHTPTNQNLYIPLFLEVISVALYFSKVHIARILFLFRFFLRQHGAFRTSDISEYHFLLRALEVMVSYTLSNTDHPKRGSSWFFSFPPDKPGDFSQVITRPSVNPTHFLIYYLLFSLPFNVVHYKVQATEKIVKNYNTVGTKVIILLLLSSLSSSSSTYL